MGLDWGRETNRITAAQLAALAQQLKPDDHLHTNTIGNLMITSPDGTYRGYIDFRTAVVERLD